MRRLLLTGFGVLGMWLTAAAQLAPPRPEVDVQRFIEQLFPVPDEDLPYEEIYEALFQYYTQPLNLNTATVENLQSLLLLTDQQIHSLLRHIRRNGPLLSLYELQSVPGWDLETIRQLLPFVEVKESSSPRSDKPLPLRLWEDGEKLLLLRYERVAGTKAGYVPAADSIPPAYLGSPDRLYARFRLHRAKDFSLGFTLEKDAGEQLAWNPSNKQYGADFISFHALFHRAGPFSKVVVGDYQLQFGQSLVLGSGFSLGKGAETITSIRRSNIGIRPYTSLLETGYFRGAAFTYPLMARLEMTTFYANTARDASLQLVDSTSESPVFNTLQLSGYHRTLRELEGRHSIREQSAGGAVHYKNRKGTLQLGATGLFTRFNRERQVLPRLYNLHAFRGRQNLVGSLFGEYLWQNFSFFGEAARSRSGGHALVGGLMASLGPGIDFSFLYRNYSPRFHSFYGTAFAEGTLPVNEKGAYWGLQYIPLQFLKFSGYFDVFRFPWLRYRVYAPNTSGYEWLLRAAYQPRRDLQLYAQVREEAKAINSQQKTPARELAEGVKRNYLLNLQFEAFKGLKLRSRVQWSSYLLEGQKTRGYVLLQDVSWQWSVLELSARLALFETDDYANRQYVYEKDVLWAFSIPAYHGKGLRQYLLLRYKISQPLTLWLRWARTSYTDRTSIGSGMEKMEGNQLNQFKAQLRWQF